MITRVNQKNNHGNTGNGILKGVGGFTLLEVIMAISILTIGLLAVASMQASAIRGNAMSRAYTESTDRAQDIAEKILSMDISDLSDDDGDGNSGLDDTGDDADHVGYTSDPKYTVYYNVATDWAGGSAINGVSTVRIIVTWTETGVQKSRSFDLLKNRL